MGITSDYKYYTIINVISKQIDNLTIGITFAFATAIIANILLIMLLFKYSK